MAVTPDINAASTPPLAARARAVGGSAVREILAVTARPEVINFAGGLPAPELFDADGIAEAFRAVLAETPARALQYSTTEGEPGLRDALAGRMAARGLPTEADDVLVTTGSQQALSLLATALVEPGDTVLVESPCYLAALQAFGFAGARVVAVPGDGDGLDPVALEELVVRERPKLLYTVPTFQNPTGRTLPARAGPRSPPWPPGGGCGSSRTTPTGSCASRGSGCRGSPPTRARRTVRSCSGPSPR